MATDIQARGMAKSAKGIATSAQQQAQTVQEKAQELEQRLDTLPSGYKFLGSVNYVSDLPASGNEVGDIYKVLYRGSSGTECMGRDYIWTKQDETESWIPNDTMALPEYPDFDPDKTYILGLVLDESHTKYIIAWVENKFIENNSSDHNAFMSLEVE